MATKLAITIDGGLEIAPSSTSANEASSSSAGFLFGLLSTSVTADADIKQSLVTINSPSVFAALPFPTNLLAHVVYLRVLNRTGPLVVKLTQATAGAIDLNVAGMLMIELPTAERISAISIKGNATFDWAAWGDES